jgi:hypothetical protein
VIDFRYHIVSLISVFLALAVGIALGAGPLKEQIGDTLTGQVNQLRTEKDALRGELDTATGNLNDSNDFLTAASSRLVGGTLTDRRVAVVLLGENDPAVVEAVTAQLATAGATVSAQVQVNDTWTNKDKSTFRQSLAGSLVTYLDPAPAKTAGPEAELAEALAQALTGAASGSPDSLSEPASIMVQLLTEGELISVKSEITTPADAIVILAGPMTPAGVTDQPSTPTDVSSAEIAIARAAQIRSEGAVVVGGTPTRGGLVKEILASNEVADIVTTVADGQDVVGQITVPLALNARIGGVNGHYGIGTGLSALPATTALPKVNRTPGTSGTGG